MFINQKQVKIKKVKNMLNNRRKDENLSWVDKYPIQIYNFIAV